MVDVALIGAGRWGRNILRDLRTIGADVLVVDPSPEARTAATYAGARVAPDLDDVGGGVDGWVVATPAGTHAAVLRRLATRSGPVLCEKPLTDGVRAAREVVDELGDRLHVLHVWRYHPAVRRLGELARSGALGDVHGVRTVRVNWTSPRTDVDSVWNLVPHDLTIAIEVLGHIPAPRTALVEVLDGRPVGMWAHLVDDDGPWLVAESSNRYGDKRREIRVHGDEAVAVLPADDHPIRIERGRGTTADVTTVEPDDGTALQRLLKAWVGHVRGGPPPLSDGAEGLAVVEAVDRLRVLAGLGTTA